MAVLIEWSDDLSVGVNDIDEQHMELVGLLNQLDTAIREHHGSAALRSTLDELVSYTQTHFAVEERLMRESDYPDYEEHRLYHEALIDQVRSLQHKLDSGEGAITFELLHFLKVWLTRHICETDKRFGAYYAARGQRPDWMPEVQKAMTERRWWQFWKFAGRR